MNKIKYGLFLFFIFSLMLHAEEYSLDNLKDFKSHDYVFELKYKSDRELSAVYDKVSIFYREDFIESGSVKTQIILEYYLIGSIAGKEYVLCHVLPGKVYDRFQNKIIDTPISESITVLGMNANIFSTPFSPELIFLKTDKSIRTSNTFATLKPDLLNFTVYKFEPAP